MAIRLSQPKVYEPGYANQQEAISQTQQANYMSGLQPVSQSVGGQLNVVGPEERTAMPIGRLAVGDWFKMRDMNVQRDYPGNVLDQGLIVLYTEQGPVLINVSGTEPCTPVNATLTWERKQFPRGDVRMN